MASDANKVLLLEPFYGGSHRQLIDLLHQHTPHCTKYVMSAKKWHWRSRTAALHFADVIAQSEHYRTLFTSSVLNLADLVALRPDLARLHKVIYFHENQLIYPVRQQKDRDFQFGYNQILSCLVADVIVFNSQFNMTSFLDGIESYLRIIPDYRPKGIAEKIQPKCTVLYFPIAFPQGTIVSQKSEAMCSETETASLNDEATLSHTTTGDKHTNTNIEVVRETVLQLSANCGMPQINGTEDCQRTVHYHKVESTLASDGGTLRRNHLHIVWPHRWYIPCNS